jgi:hypothetical protein
LLNGLLAVVAQVAVGRRWIGASRGRSRFSDLIQVNASHPAAMRIPVWTKNAEGATRMYSVTGEMPKIWNMLACLAAIGLLAGAMLNAAVGHIAAWRGRHDGPDAAVSSNIQEMTGSVRP